MFFRPHGRQVLLLHSYRDQQGRVRHRQLRRFPSGQFHQVVAGWEQLRGELTPRCSGWKVNWERLRERAQELSQRLQPTAARQVRPDRLQQLARGLARALEQTENHGPIEVELGQIQAQAGRLASQRPQQQLVAARARLPQQRGRFDPTDPQVQPYRQELSQRGQRLWQQGRLDEALEVYARWVQDCPDSEARNGYGALLQLAGRDQEALIQYAAQPLREAVSRYHKAALLHARNRLSESLDSLLEAMLRDPSVALELEAIERGARPQPGGYWSRYACLWSPEAQQFALRVSGLMAVKRRLLAIKNEGRRPHWLIRPHYLHLFHQKLGIGAVISP